MGQEIDREPPTVRKCVFCGAPNPGETPLWPHWIIDFLPRTDATAPLGPRPLLACAACITGWIESLNEKVRKFMDPLLHGQAVTLSAEQVKLLSGSVTLIAMKAAFLTRHCGICAGDRAYLRHTGQPPKNWGIFVAGLSGTAWSNACMHRPYRIEFSGNPLTTHSKGQPTKTTNTQLLSIGIGPMFFHIFSSPSLLLMNDFMQSSRKQRLTQLWPMPRRFGLLPPAGLHMPPERTLTDTEASQLADVFADCLHRRLPAAEVYETAA